MLRVYRLHVDELIVKRNNCVLIGPDRIKYPCEISSGSEPSCVIQLRPLIKERIAAGLNGGANYSQ